MTGPTAWLRYWAASALGATFLRILGGTLRVRVEGDGPIQELRHRGEPIVFAFWHSRILPLAILHRNQGVVVLISEHGDGEYIARTVERMGFGTSRGSSTRGGSRGLRGLVRAARKGHDLAFTPDGPQGPARRFKTGALVAAQLIQAPLVPVSAGGPSLWRVGSWDRMVIPKPFSRLNLKYGEPRWIPRDAGPQELDTHAREIEAVLNRLGDEVDERVEDESREAAVLSGPGAEGPRG